MKNKKNMKPTCTGVRSFASLATVALLLAGAAACTEDLISQPVGELPDEAAIGRIGSTMRSGLSFTGRGEVVLAEPVEGEEPETVVADELYYELSQPAAADTKVTLSIGTGLTPEFLAEVERINATIKEINKTLGTHPSKFRIPALFPARNLRLETTELLIPAGKTRSGACKLSVSNHGLGRDSLYLLPVEVRVTKGDGHGQMQLLQYKVHDHPTILKDEAPGVWPNGVALDEDFMTVFYVNTETYQPLIADVFGYDKTNMMTWQSEKQVSIGNIVNLKPAVVGYDAAGSRAVLALGPDLRYVLENAAKYIRPLQERGRKVCVCIQGGGKGLGFCNLSDAQIADFTAQVKKVVEDYGLDGVNLWDEGAKYGKDGMPAVNTTSYPKLIQALREALPNKLLTLVDKDEPTEYFHDVSACGGIEVGKYIDYAWSGYNNEKEIVQIIEPWATDHPYAEIVRKPIAGMLPERYGSLNVPKYGNSMEEQNISQLLSPKRVIDWKTAGRKKNDMLVFGFDLTANEQTVYEGQPYLAFMFLALLADDGSKGEQNPWTGEWQIVDEQFFYMSITTNPAYNMGYGLYKKNW